MECYPDMRNCDCSRAHVLISIVLTLFTPLANAEAVTGRVVGITDGDTVSLLVERQQYTIRIAGIDAPERHQAWGERSKSNLSRLCLNQTAVADCSKISQQGQMICKLTVKAVDIGLEQLKDGMAWWYMELAREQPSEVQSAYQSAELMAQLKRRGLWRETNPMPPWDFRRENRVFPEQSDLRF
jgi:endonuclease YncB( thermonuclease family)